MFAKRRLKTVVRVTIAYVAVGFALIQGAAAIEPALSLPAWARSRTRLWRRAW